MSLGSVLTFHDEMLTPRESDVDPLFESQKRLPDLTTLSRQRGKSE
jgi:hypothetical protein